MVSALESRTPLQMNLQRRSTKGCRAIVLLEIDN